MTPEFGLHFERQPDADQALKRYEQREKIRVTEGAGEDTVVLDVDCLVAEDPHRVEVDRRPVRE